MEALLVSTGVVALAEIGDKTQLLALILAARYRKPLPIAFGILVATLVNHGLAAWLGTLALPRHGRLVPRARQGGGWAAVGRQGRRLPRHLDHCAGHRRHHARHDAGQRAGGPVRG